MKKILAVIFAAICFLGVQNASAIVAQTSDFYVNDAANVLSEDTERFIMEHSVALAEQTKAQIVVVTVPNLEGMSLEEYATTLFRQYGIGDAELNKGVLMLLALEERQSRIEVGYGLEGRLTDGKTGRIQDDYMIPYYKDNDFNNGILNGYKALYEEVCQEYGLESDAVPVHPITANYSDLNDINTDRPEYVVLLSVHFFISLILSALVHVSERFSKRLTWLAVWAVAIFGIANLFILIFDSPYEA